MENNKLIDHYGMDVNDIETSPFEALNMLHTRSSLEKVIDDLSLEEKIKLYTYDMILIQNASKMSKHIQAVYDFSTSKQSINEWWWHLDKIATGEISFNVSITVQSNQAM